MAVLWEASNSLRAKDVARMASRALRASVSQVSEDTPGAAVRFSQVLGMLLAGTCVSSLQIRMMVTCTHELTDETIQAVMEGKLREAYSHKEAQKQVCGGVIVCCCVLLCAAVCCCLLLLCLLLCAAVCCCVCCCACMVSLCVYWSLVVEVCCSLLSLLHDMSLAAVHDMFHVVNLLLVMMMRMMMLIAQSRRGENVLCQVPRSVAVRGCPCCFIAPWNHH